MNFILKKTGSNRAAGQLNYSTPIEIDEAGKSIDWENNGILSLHRYEDDGNTIGDSGLNISIAKDSPPFAFDIKKEGIKEGYVWKLKLKLAATGKPFQDANATVTIGEPFISDPPHGGPKKG